MQGTTEINLIAQDTTAYGMDLYGELALSRLLEGLGAIAGLRWVRLLYCYPTMMTDRLIQHDGGYTANVAHYVDIPLQHGDDGMLKRMKRGGSVASYLRLFDRLRGAMPDVTLRTTFMVGFPGEDDAAFANLERFVDAARFDRLGVFEYSPEEGTLGFELTPRVPRKIAATRRRALMARQQPISLARNTALVGQDMDVLVESYRAEAGAIARSWRDAPEIDGTVVIRPTVGQPPVVPGSWQRVRIVEAQPYDLIAETCAA